MCGQEKEMRNCAALSNSQQVSLNDCSSGTVQLEAGQNQGFIHKNRMDANYANSLVIKICEKLNSLPVTAFQNLCVYHCELNNFLFCVYCLSDK